MSMQQSPQQMAEAAERFTVEQWEGLSRDWLLPNKYLAVILRGMTRENRQAMSVEALADQGIGGLRLDDPEVADWLAGLCLLSEEALDKLIASFSEEERRSFGVD